MSIMLTKYNNNRIQSCIFRLEYELLTKQFYVIIPSYPQSSTFLKTTRKLLIFEWSFLFAHPLELLILMIN